MQNNSFSINKYLKTKLSYTNLIFYLNFLFIACSLYLVVKSNYLIYDGFWTPLRSLYRALSTELWFLKPVQISNYVSDTIHNDSVKIIPSLIDYAFSVPFDYWNPRVSVLLGVLSWILCYVLFTRLLFKIFELNKNYKQLLSIFLAISFFSSAFYSIRFTTIGALGKTLPILCSILISTTIFKKKIDYKLTILDLTKIFLLCLIGQFSFVSGNFLWINTIVFLMVKNFFAKNSVSKFKIYVFTFLSVILLVIYFATFNHLHIYELTIGNIESVISNKNPIIIGLKYLSFIATSTSVYFNGTYYFGEPFFIILSIINLITFSVVFYKLISRKRYIFNKFELFKISPLLFLITFNLYGTFAAYIGRFPRYFEARYFCENIILSFSLLMLLVFFLIKADKISLVKKIISITLVISISNLIGFLMSTKKYVFSAENSDVFSDNKIVYCIRNEINPTFDNLIENCKLDQSFRYISKVNPKYHQSIIINDPDDYAKKVYRVFGNKNQPN